MDKAEFNEEIELSLLKDIPLSFAKGNLVLPIRRENGELLAAVAGERGSLALKELASHHGLAPRAVHIPAGELLGLINRFYGQIGSAEEVMENIAGDDLSSVATEFERPRDILELTEEAPIIRLLNALLQQAVKDRASDIHVEPYEKELEVRFRVDGIMRKVLGPPKIIQDALLSRVKIMANLDIAEKRLPQDGRIRLLVAGRDIDIRVSIVPTSFGERAVLRLLDRMQGILGLGEVGLNDEDAAVIERLIGRTNGILLVTGPTGSGKTTTLYAALGGIISEEKNVITVEDPVEYQLEGVGQIQVNPRIGLSFASGLRSILRQDPDVIMVGEIRDYETAEIAIQASLTGHLVLSTLHTNDAATAIIRLIDMGVEPFLVASSLMGVLAQRLLRRICPHCRARYEPTAAEAAYFEAPPGHVSRGAGCERCNSTGYLGRVGIFELLLVTPEIVNLISSRADARSINGLAVSAGMKTLRGDGLQKAAEGMTTLEEVLRVTQKDHAGI
jgi:general secretion pathway protein E